MSNAVSRRVFLADTLCLAAAVTLQGCGSVDWFPSYQRQSTTPDPFAFTNKTGVALNTSVTSDPITVSGLTADSSPISITGPAGSNSQYAINGGSPTSASGTVKNGDKVTVSQTSSNSLGGSVTSTLSIGNVSGTFTSVTQTVTLSSFSTPVFANTAAGIFQSFAVITASDGPGGHIITSQDASFALTDATGTVLQTTTFQSFLRWPALNGLGILVRNLFATSSTVTVTVTIDGVDFKVTL